MARPKTGANRTLYAGQMTADIPATPVAFVLRNQSDSLEGKTELIQSGELLPGRAASEPMPGQSSNGGGVPFELSALSFDRLLSAVMMSNWKVDSINPKVSTLEPGNIAKKFWILKHFSEADHPLWQLFKGVQVDSIDLTFAVNAIVTGTFNLLGIGDPELETANPVSGLSSLPAVLTTSPFTSRKGFLKMGGVALTYGKEFKITIKNNLAALGALFQTDALIVEKMFDVNGSITAYLTDEVLFNHAVAGDKLTFEIQVEDAAGNSYLFKLSNTKLDTHSTAAGSRDELAPQYPFTAFGTNVVKITRTLAKAPTLYDLTLDGNSKTSGSEPAAQKDLEAGSLVYAPDNTGSLVKTGYTFAGWNTAAAGTGTYYAVGDPILIEGNVKLYAKWDLDE